MGGFVRENWKELGKYIDSILFFEAVSGNEDVSFVNRHTIKRFVLE